MCMFSCFLVSFVKIIWLETPLRTHTCVHTPALSHTRFFGLVDTLSKHNPGILSSSHALTRQGRGLMDLTIRKRAVSRFRQFIPFVSNRKGLSLSHTPERRTLRRKGRWLPCELWGAQQPVLDKLTGHVVRSPLPIPRCLHAQTNLLPLDGGSSPSANRQQCLVHFWLWEQYHSHKKFQRQKPILLSF